MNLIEPLESRIAPAVVVLNPTTATYTDVDGDIVTIKVSLGTLATGLFATTAVGLGDQLQAINLSNGGFDGTNLTLSVKQRATGDGLANVGYINSTTQDLGKVTIKGDLGRIDAGDATTATPGVKSLNVRSMGRFGTATQAASGNLESDIVGALGVLKVKGDIAGAFIAVTGNADSRIGAVTIGGSLIGGSDQLSGAISCVGRMGPVKIGHDVRAGSGQFSGLISSSFGKLTGVTIGGSLIGGSGSFSGLITARDIGLVKIGHDLRGGSDGDSGFIQADGKLTGVTIGGSLIDGRIFSTGDMGLVKIGHDIVGGSTPSPTRSGYIESLGRIAGVTIGGSIISGIDDSTGGSLTKNASIRAGADLGFLTVKGSLIGHRTPNGDSPVIISARGQAVQGATTDLAIGKITIGGQVEFARILAGYDRELVAMNGDAQIGAVKVGGDWIASSLVAGVKNTASGNISFGDGNDASIGAGSPSITAKIARITIKGLVLGSPSAVSTTDHFGFCAQQIGSFKSLGFTAPLTSAPNEVIQLSLATADVTIREV
jgi:hypothetical protein